MSNASLRRTASRLIAQAIHGPERDTALERLRSLTNEQMLRLGSVTVREIALAFEVDRALIEDPSCEYSVSVAEWRLSQDERFNLKEHPHA